MKTEWKLNESSLKLIYKNDIYESYISSLELWNADRYESCFKNGQ